MDIIASILLLLALAVLVALFIARPFLFSRRAPAFSADEHQLSTLLADRDRLITSLQELDFDQALGKIPAEDYPRQRAALLQRGIEVLRQLDALQPAAAPELDAESRMEAAIATRRADAPVPHAAPMDDEELEMLIASRRSQRKERSGGFCPKCGNAFQQSDKFCPRCGKSLN